MNSFIILLIILLGSLILNQIFNKMYNITEGIDTKTIVEKCKCPKCDADKVKKKASKNNANYKTLVGDYKDLKLQLKVVKDQNGKIQNKLAGNKAETQNAVGRAEFNAKQEEKKINKSANAFK